jgi:hypothetical protein
MSFLEEHLKTDDRFSMSRVDNQNIKDSRRYNILKQTESAILKRRYLIFAFALPIANDNV